MLTLSRHLGTLTTGWVVSLTDYKLTPAVRTPTILNDGGFGV